MPCCPERIRRALGIVLTLLLVWAVFPVRSQDTLPPLEKAPPSKENPEAPAAKVDVEPVSEDEEIGNRLERILTATGWFTEPTVQVDQGVVTLRGRAQTEQQKKWAGDLARNTQDVVAVVNRIDVAEAPIWDFSPAITGLSNLGRDLIRGLPWVVFTLLVLILAWLAGKITRRIVRWALKFRVKNALLRGVMAWTAGLAVFLIGLYVVLQVAGLTRLALTVIGGTGVLGLVLGIAFRDISENFLASLFLSMQHPFRTGDLIEVAGILGFVQRTTVRSTVLMTLDGNHVQVPNATVYKAVIRNFTSNPNRREEFEVGIGYEVPIDRAQAIALQVLADHPAVLKDPEPWVLANNLGKATVALKVYFWLNGTTHSWLKVRSSVIRLVKRAFQEAGISMPDEAREVLFPQGVNVRLIREPLVDGDGKRPSAERRQHTVATDESATAAEGGLTSEAKEIREQARQARTPEEGENLLRLSATDGGA